MICSWKFISLYEKLSIIQLTIEKNWGNITPIGKICPSWIWLIASSFIVTYINSQENYFRLGLSFKMKMEYWNWIQSGYFFEARFKKQIKLLALQLLNSPKDDRKGKMNEIASLAPVKQLHRCLRSGFIFWAIKLKVKK